MKSYLSLIPISAKIRKKNNRLTIVCIAISVFLVTSIFSIAEMGIRMEKNRLLDKHSELTFQDILSSNMVKTILPVVAILFVLILLAGILMISGSINSNVAQRTQFFGMMRCIGMSKKQIIRFVRLESLNWCKVAIPFGISTGIVITWILCGVLRYVVGEEFSNIPILGISLFGIIAGIMVGLFTVLIAAIKPAKQAANVSPIAAVSGNVSNHTEVKNVVGTKFLKIETSLGISHAILKKNNMLRMSGSFALSIILFLSFSVFINFVDYVMPQSYARPDIEISSNDSLNTIDSHLLSELRKIDGVKYIYGRRSKLDVIGKLNSNKLKNIDIVSYDKYDLEALKKDGILKKGSNLSKVFNNSSYVLSTWDKSNKVKNGDKIKINNNIFEVAGLLKYNPFSSERDSENKITLIVSNETFTNITKETGYQLVMIQVDKEISNKNIKLISDIVGDKGIVRDRRDQKTTSTYMAFMFFVYGFLTIIASVTLLNIINSISISVTAKIKQYGMMQAIGMGKKQIKKMIAMEAITYAFFGGIIGCVLGISLNKFLFSKLIGNHFSYAVWEFPFKSIVIIIIFLILSVRLAVYAPSKRMENMEIIETINKL
ncbi:TPA: ABC transporter permease [Streptococcus pyogenes]